MAVDVARVSQIRSNLARKATFEKAVAEARAWAEADGRFATSPEAVQLASRCIALLRSRYTSTAFWKASLDLFQVCMLLCSPLLLKVFL